MLNGKNLKIMGKFTKQRILEKSIMLFGIQIWMIVRFKKVIQSLPENVFIVIQSHRKFIGTIFF